MLAKLLPPSLMIMIMTLQEFLEIYDAYEKDEDDAPRRTSAPPVTSDQMTDAERANQDDEMRDAVESVGAVFAHLKAEDREQDVWENNCVATAIDALYRGIYGLAVTEVFLAFTPPERRAAPAGGASEREQFDIDALQ